MKTNHTKGPWHVHANKSSLGFRIDSAGNEWQGLAEIYQAPGLEAEGEANAHLISAAPELLMSAKLTYSMLEALIAPMSVIDMRIGTQITDILRSMTMIIDKAEGRLK